MILTLLTLTPCKHERKTVWLAHDAKYEDMVDEGFERGCVATSTKAVPLHALMNELFIE